MVSGGEAALAGHGRIEVLRPQEPQAALRFGVRPGQHRCGQAVFVQLAGKAVAHPAVKADPEGQQQRQQRAVPPGVVLEVPHHIQRSALLFVERMHLQRHQAAGGLHPAEEVHGEQDQLHGGDEGITLEQSHRAGLRVLSQLRQVLVPVVGAARGVQ